MPTLQELEAELAELKQPTMSELEAELSMLKGQDPRVLTSPVPTGIEEIDRAGETVRAPITSRVVASKDVPSLDELPFDHPYRLRKQLGDEGVDQVSGLPFLGRREIAKSPQLVHRRAAAVKRTMESLAQQVPEDMEPKFRYDTLLQEWQAIMPDKEQPGKYRWTSLDGTGIELGDLGDMFDPAEQYSIAGGIGGTVGAGKVPRFMNWTKTKLALGGFGGGLTGRAAGDAQALWRDYLKTGYVPTPADFRELQWDALKVEAFAAGAGEFGAAILRGFSNLGQDLAAKAGGKQAISGTTAADLRVHNANLAQTRQDMKIISQVLGKEDLPVTRGEATHSIELISDEAHAAANMSAKEKRKFLTKQAHGKRTTQEYINTVWGGNEQFLGDRAGTILRANKSLYDLSIVVAQNEDGIIRFAPEDFLKRAGMDPKGFGLKVDPGPADGATWRVTGAQLTETDNTGALVHDVSGIGIGPRLYTAAANEATANGKILVSSDTMRSNARAVWEKIDGTEAVGELKWNPHSWNDQLQLWESIEGGPIVQMKPLDSLTEEYLGAYTKAAQGPTGRLEAAREFKRVIRKPLPKERGRIAKEVENPFAKEQWREAILADYNRNVPIIKNGKEVMSAKNFDQWKKETGPQLEMFFDDAEMIRIHSSPGGLRSAVLAGRGRAQREIDSLEKVLRVGPEWKGWTDNKPIFNQLKKLEGVQQLRAMRALDSVGLGDSIRGLFKEELRLDLINKTKAANFGGFDKWLTTNKPLIENIIGPQRASEYIAHLNVLKNILKRRSDRAMVLGSQAEANPAMLAMTRVAFGPLSRSQRFFSAARRLQIRAGSASIGDIITDPDLLKRLVELQYTPVTNRAAARFIQESGLIDSFWFDEERFDWENEDHRQQVANTVMLSLQLDEELTHSP